MIGYNQIVRSLTEWTGTNQQGILDQTSIAEGIGGIAWGTAAPTGEAAGGALGMCNIRQSLIQGVGLNVRETRLAANDLGVQTPMGPGFGCVPNGEINPTPLTQTVRDYITGVNPTRRYQVQLALGLFNQEKLIPTKFMASQLAIEITLANPSECMIYRQAGTSLSTNPTYIVKNVNLIPEILEFDASYDESFLKGLMSGGVPIKFATWNNYRFNTAGSSNVNLQIQERSRSVKAIFALQRRDPPSISTDTGASFFNSSLVGTESVGTTFQEYQYRIGGRYFPAQPVQNAIDVGGSISNGGAESYVELAKAVNTLGDYRLSSTCNITNWAVNPGSNYPSGATPGALDSLAFNIMPEQDYRYALGGYGRYGSPYLREVEATSADVTATSSNNSFSGNQASSCFAMAIDLETSNGIEISGLNAEEQSDISLIARFKDTQNTSFIYDVYTYIDTMIVLRENNVRKKLIVGFRTYPISHNVCYFNKWLLELTILLNILS